MRVNVEVDLAEFPADEVLWAALAIVRRNAADPALRGPIRDLQNHFAAEIEDESLPPRSTAARVQSLEEAKAAVA